MFDLTITETILYTLLSAIGVYTFLQYNKSHSLRVKERTDGQPRLLGDYKVKEWIDPTTNTVYWITQFWHKKLKLEKPPASCICTTKTGKMSAEVEKVGKDQFIYYEHIPAKPTVNKEGKTEYIDLGKINQYSVTEREAMVNQHSKATLKRKNSWTSPEVIIPMISLTVLAMVIICGMVFWGDLAKPAIQSSQINLQILERQEQILQSLGVKNIAQTVPPASVEPIDPLGVGKVIP